MSDNKVNKKISIVIIALLVIVLFSNLKDDLTGAAIQSFPGWSYCSSTNQCSSGLGDCDKNADCQAGFRCVQDVGNNYGWPNSADVCESAVQPTSTGSFTVTQKKEVLQMLNTCNIKFQLPSKFIGNEYLTCNDICARSGEICIDASAIESGSGNKPVIPYGCDMRFNLGSNVPSFNIAYCRCCSS